MSKFLFYFAVISVVLSLSIYMYPCVHIYVSLCNTYINIHIYLYTNKSISNEVTIPPLKLCSRFSSKVTHTIFVEVFASVCSYTSVCINIYTWLLQRHNSNFNCFWGLYYQGGATGWWFALDKLGMTRCAWVSMENGKVTQITSRFTLRSSPPFLILLSWAERGNRWGVRNSQRCGSCQTMS